MPLEWRTVLEKKEKYRGYWGTLGHGALWENDIFDTLCSLI
jgi:hypothetical protein